MTTAFTLAPSSEYFTTKRFNDLNVGLFFMRKPYWHLTNAVIFNGGDCTSQYTDDFNNRFPGGIRNYDQPGAPGGWVQFVEDPGLMKTTDDDTDISKPLASNEFRNKILRDAKTIQEKIGKNY